MEHDKMVNAFRINVKEKAKWIRDEGRRKFFSNFFYGWIIQHRTELVYSILYYTLVHIVFVGILCAQPSLQILDAVFV